MSVCCRQATSENIPSMMKIHCQPFRPPTPAILERAYPKIPPNAPASTAPPKKTATRLLISSCHISFILDCALWRVTTTKRLPLEGGNKVETEGLTRLYHPVRKKFNPGKRPASNIPKQNLSSAQCPRELE